MNQRPTPEDPLNCPMCGAHDYGLMPLGKCVHCLERKLAAAQKDAERYRWLRKFKRGCPIAVIRMDQSDGDTIYCDEDLDAAIDAAKESKP